MFFIVVLGRFPLDYHMLALFTHAWHHLSQWYPLCDIFHTQISVTMDIRAQKSGFGCERMSAPRFIGREGSIYNPITVCRFPKYNIACKVKEKIPWHNYCWLTKTQSDNKVISSKNIGCNRCQNLTGLFFEVVYNVIDIS